MVHHQGRPLLTQTLCALSAEMPSGRERFKNISIMLRHVANNVYSCMNCLTLLEHLNFTVEIALEETHACPPPPPPPPSQIMKSCDNFSTGILEPGIYCGRGEGAT